MFSLRTLLVVVLCGASLVAAPQQPVFRASTDVVAVDVLVVDKAGHPLTDLASEDFAVTVDGKPRRIASVQLVRYDNPQSTAPDRTAIPNIRPEDRVMRQADYSSNTKSDPGRMFVLIIDQGNMTRGAGRGAMVAAGEFVNRLAPNDLVALVSLPVGVSVDFTADRLAIRQALLRVLGGGANKYQANRNISLAESFALVTGSQRRLWDAALREECMWARSDNEFENCRSTLEADARNKFAAARSSAESSEHALEILLRRLGLIDGQKHLIFLSEALVTGSSFGYLDGFSDLVWLGALAQASRVNLYVLHLDRAFLEANDVSERFPTRTPIEDAHLLNDGLTDLVGLAGGAYFNLTATISPTLDRIARETSASYLVTFDTVDADRDGKPHGIAVKVARPEVVVRARTQFVADPALRLATSGERLTRALNSPLLGTAIPVDITTSVIGDPQGGGVRVLVAAEIGCAPEAPQGISVGYTVTDAAGSGSASAVAHPESIVLRADGSRCVYFSSSFGMKSGEFAVRLAALGPDNRLGGVEHHLDARLTPAGPLGLSSLVLTDPAVRVDGKMKMVVNGAVSGPTVAAYIDMQRMQPASDPAAASMKPDVQFDVAESDDGEPLVGIVPTVIDAEGPGSWYAEGEVNLAALAPGTYTLRATVLLDGKRVGRLSRTITRAASPQAR